MARKSKGAKARRSRKTSVITGFISLAVLISWALAGMWFVHHSRRWLTTTLEDWPVIVTAPLMWMGNPISDITDGLGITGHDAVYEYDEEAPIGNVTFAGTPRRVSAPAPNDVRIIDRGEFLIGWSDTLRHPLWCAYHVAKECKFGDGKRPSFMLDKTVTKSPRPEDYTHQGYDRGHMVPNHAIISRYGENARRKTFMMSNISPQTAALNRGVWRDVEHRIADLWTARYGEIWVVIGAIPSSENRKLGTTGIDIPGAYYQIVIAQEDQDVRAFAVLFEQDVQWGAWPTRYLISIDELETLTGLDFNPEMPSFIQDPLEAELPSRLWPVRAIDIFSQIASHFTN